MVSECGRLAESPVTEATYKWLLHGVYAHVRAEVAPRVEPPPAQHTLQLRGREGRLFREGRLMLMLRLGV